MSVVRVLSVMPGAAAARAADRRAAAAQLAE